MNEQEPTRAIRHRLEYSNVVGIEQLLYSLESATAERRLTRETTRLALLARGRCP